MKYSKLLVKLGIILVLTTMAIPLMPAAPATAYTHYVSITPDHGPVGTEVHLFGNSFTPSVTSANQSLNTTTFAKTYFPDQTTLVKTTVINSGGIFETYFVIGQHPAGAHRVWVYDGAASPPVWASVRFTIEPKIKLSKSTGFTGDNITISGTGFAANSTATIYFDDSEIAAVTSNQSGSFATVAIIPDSSNGSHNVKAVDASNNQSTGLFTIKQRLVVSPVSGPIGQEVTISGTGFAAQQNITVTFADSIVVTSPESVKTSYSGNFSGKFLVPFSGTNPYTIEVSDGSNKAYATFRIVLGGKLNRVIGYIGNDVTFRGAGFTPGRIAIIYFDNIRVAETTVDANSSFSANFTVPVSSNGEHTVMATDGTYSTNLTFTTVLVPSGTMNRIIGYVGSDVIFSGTGFVPDKIIAIYYDSSQVAEATVDADGNFSANFIVPASSGGEHRVSATDGTHSANVTFTMESTAPPTPSPLLPANASSVEPQTHFIWQGVTDSSGITYTLQVATNPMFTSGNTTSIVLEKRQLAATAYTLTLEEQFEPTKEEITYYWRVRAIDNAANTSSWSPVREFYMASQQSAASSWFIYSLLAESGIFISIILYWSVRRIV